MKCNLTITIASAFIALIMLAVIACSVYRSIQFDQEVKTLFARSRPVSRQVFRYSQLSGLPRPVQHYFKHTLNDGQPYIRYARITHGGQFKSAPDKDWVNIKGEQYATTDKPGFIWKGVTTLFTARDRYIADSGRLVVAIFGLVKIVDGKGPSYNQGELLRWLGESVLYPTNLLPGPRLKWFPIDAHHARFTFNYEKLALFYRVSFNDEGEITQMETKRYMDKDKLETWIIKMTNYRQLHAIAVPTTFEVLWRLKTGDLPYAKFNILKVEYDRPERF